MALKLPRLTARTFVTDKAASTAFSRFWDAAMTSIEEAFNNSSSVGSQIDQIESTAAFLTADNNFTGNNSFQSPIESPLGLTENGVSVVLPPGGTAGQTLTKNSSADFDASFTDLVLDQIPDLSSLYDALGAAATAQTNAEAYAGSGDAATLVSAKSYADTGDASTLSAAEAYSANASNLASGTVATSRLPSVATQLGTQAANKVYAGPSTGSAAAPAFRSLVSADIPSLSSLYDAAGAAATAQSNAETFSANAANITSGDVAAARLSAALLTTGTWTPTYTSTGTPPTLTYATQSGTYLKFGGICILTFDIQTASVSAVGTGTLEIGGLPFANANASPCSYFATFVQNFTGASLPYVGAIGAGGQVIAWRDSTFTSVTVSALNTAAGNKNRLQGTIIMPVAWP